MEVRLIELLDYYNCKSSLDLFYKDHIRKHIANVPMWYSGYNVKFFKAGGVYKYMGFDSSGFLVKRDVTREYLADVFIRTVDYHKLIGEPLAVNYDNLKGSDKEPLKKAYKSNENTERFFEVGVAILMTCILGSQVFMRAKQEYTKHTK